MSQYGYPPSGGPPPAPPGTHPYGQVGAGPNRQGSAPPYPQTGGAPYPQGGGAPYPQGGGAPNPQGGGAPYSQGGGTPYSQGGGAPYPQGGGAPYPQGGAPPRPQGSAPPYPQKGASPYPQGGSSPYSSASAPPSAPSNPQTSSPPYPAQNQVLGTQGILPGPQYGPGSGPTGNAPSGHGAAPHEKKGKVSKENGSHFSEIEGQSPYPGQGAPAQHGGHSYVPNQGQSPYPGQGAPAQHGGHSYVPNQGQSIYPVPGQGAHVNQGTTPYQTQGTTYPGQNVPAYNPAGVRPGTDQFKTRIEISLECRNLLNKDVLSKSDPCACLYMMQAGRWSEVGRTENVMNNLNPKFSKTFVVNYFFEEVQKVLIAVYDIDNITPQLTDDDFLGQVETTLGQIVSNSPFTSALVLKNGMRAGQGSIIIRTEEIKEGCETALLTFRAAKLDKKDFFGKSDPYLEIQRASADGSWQVVHRTEVIKNNLNPIWRPFELSLQKLCGGNKQQNIKIDCFDWDSDGSHDYIGGFVTTFDEMSRAAQQEVSWACINQGTKAKKKNYTNSGTIFLTSCKIIKEYTFLDFIKGGTQINFTVGIDFTASNGNPSQSTSLHYINPYQPNEYMAAIKAVGEVCQDYDTDKLFPVLGFGARIPPKMEISHEFAVNFNPQNPYCAGIDGILQAYFNCIQHVQLYGPTNAAPIIQHVARFAQTAQMEERTKGAHAYFILLMLTDGVLSDMSNTKSAVVEASKLPMSLIIVGVGQADFNDMNILDGDNGVLRSATGEPAKRDIVQFVPFRDFKNSSPVELARHVLAEVPKQITDYYKMRGLQPIKKPES